LIIEILLLLVIQKYFIVLVQVFETLIVIRKINMFDAHSLKIVGIVFEIEDFLLAFTALITRQNPISFSSN
jgi:hypothetical protein